MKSSCIGARILVFFAFCALAGVAGADTSANTGPDVRILDASAPAATIEAVASGSLDSHFTGTSYGQSASRSERIWLRVQTDPQSRKDVIPVLVVHAGILHKVNVYAAGPSGQPLPQARTPRPSSPG